MPHILSDNSGNPVVDENNNPVYINQFDKVIYMDKAATADKITVPHSSAIDFGIQDNWAISTWVALVVPSTSSPRWELFTKRLNPSGNTITGYELIVIQITTTQYRIVFSCWAAGVNTVNDIYYDINEDIRGKWLHILVEKYNSTPASSVSIAEWKLMVNGKAVTPLLDLNALTPSSNIKNTIPALINAFDRTQPAPSSPDLPATMYQGPLSVFKTNTRQLTTDEKNFLFQNDGILPGTLAHSAMQAVVYPINQSSGTSLIDTSGTASHGTLSGFTSTTSGNANNAYRDGITLNAA
jgi:hypothetical protein